MNGETSYTVEELAQLLKISKLKVYDLIKKGELPSYRVGRQMRVDASDLEAYKRASRSAVQAERSAESAAPSAEGGRHAPASFIEPSALHRPESFTGGEPPAETPAGRYEAPQPAKAHTPADKQPVRNLVITGQDLSLDLLATHLEARLPASRPLRSYAGSLDSLIAMYRGESDIVSTHLLDGDTGDYNLPYIRRLLVGFPYLVVNLLSRSAGLYVRTGNPLNIRSWSDLAGGRARLVNRERGSGARVLLDEQLRLHGIPVSGLPGYSREEYSHLAVAGSVSRGDADVGVGTEKAARIIDGVEFIPLIQERYDLVMLKKPEHERWVAAVLDVLRSTAFRSELGSMHGHDLSRTGEILYESE
ncbi:substrate-binding domain-containing protein [Paenibacillus sp. CN-4]|uniref:substrate-binding domain-containing protein n=1 Tax=Paenibacillus nanchangensis TaxID=3348343 RepID=UPI00397E1090